jgi:glycosyltransferase involved in cell wall biosynthesis
MHFPGQRRNLKNSLNPESNYSEEAPLVSVILAVYNRAISVARAINSVLAQTYPRLELIVVDDGSTDGTGVAVAKFGSRVKLISQDHTGVYPARNNGLRHASGDLVAFIDADDAWFPDKLAQQVPLMRPEVGLVFADAIHVTKSCDGAPRTGNTCFLVTTPHRGRVAEQLKWGNFVPTCTALVRRSCLEQIGGFREVTAISADYLAWFQIALRHEVDYVDRPLAEYTVHPEGISYDLGKSLAARIELFSRERQRTQDPEISALLGHLLFNLGLHLAIATIRGRARSVFQPFRLAWHTAFHAAKFNAAPWICAFFLHQMLLRARRTVQ